MCEYEFIFCKAIHEQLKEKINGGLWIRVENDNHLWVDIIQKEINMTTSIRIKDPFSKLIVNGYSVNKACEEIVKQYKQIILKRCFK